MDLKFWTGPIPEKSTRHKPLLDYLLHPLKRHLARLYLKLLKTLGCTVIGITGSFGKTSTKDALYSILAQVASTNRTTANIDPVYNIPDTILKTPPWTRYLIIEMGIEYPGEMAFYVWLAPVDIAILTGVGITHTEFLTNPETIKQEKSQIATNARKFFDYSQKRPHFDNTFKLATEVATYLGISRDKIRSGLKTFTPPPHRMHRFSHSSGAVIVDDTYNANPTATKLAVEALVEMAKEERKTPVFVFGQMNELGKYEASAHKDIGKLIKKLGIKYLLTIGPATKFTIKQSETGARYASNIRLVKALLPYLNSKFILLIKGSRSWHLEEVVDQLLNTKN